MDRVSGLGEELAEHAHFCAEAAQGCDGVGLKFGALERAQGGPAEAGRRADFAALEGGRIGEGEVGALFEGVALAYAVVAEGVGGAPDFGEDAAGGHG